MVNTLSEFLTAMWTLSNGKEIWLLPFIGMGILAALAVALWVMAAAAAALFWIGDRAVAPVWRWFGIEIEIKGSDHTFYRLVTVFVPIVFIYALFHEELRSSWWLFWWALWVAMQMHKLYEVCRPFRDDSKRRELDPDQKQSVEEAANRSLEEILTR